mmetsp:Transcript_40186/g.106054  ORF Transcript_40186/g.106054 Transcript_40186/m.106054 type:complete len:310 (+) Transcript_40186:1093-2022(+)
MRPGPAGGSGAGCQLRSAGDRNRSSEVAWRGPFRAAQRLRGCARHDRGPAAAQEPLFDHGCVGFGALRGGVVCRRCVPPGARLCRPPLARGGRLPRAATRLRRPSGGFGARARAAAGGGARRRRGPHGVEAQDLRARPRRPPQPPPADPPLRPRRRRGPLGRLAGAPRRPRGGRAHCRLAAPHRRSWCWHTDGVGRRSAGTHALDAWPWGTHCRGHAPPRCRLLDVAGKLLQLAGPPCRRDDGDARGARGAGGERPRLGGLAAAPQGERVANHSVLGLGRVRLGQRGEPGANSAARRHRPYFADAPGER